MNQQGRGVYVDTCLLVSLFHGDSGYRSAETWLASITDQNLWISHWVLLEFASATAVRLRRGDLMPPKAGAMQAALETFRQERLALLEPRGEDFLLARDWIQAAAESGLRAADGLHLALARRQGLRLASADQTLVAAARTLGIETDLVR